MSTDHVRITPAVQQILTVLVTDPHNEIYGYRIMDALGFRLERHIAYSPGWSTRIGLSETIPAWTGLRNNRALRTR